MTFAGPDGTEKQEDPRVDAVQQEVMATISPDGRPAELAGSRAGWKGLVVVGLVAAIVGVSVLFITLGPAAGGLASILLVGYIALTVPVWGAGLLRGREERVAHQIAKEVVHPDHRDSGR